MGEHGGRNLYQFDPAHVKRGQQPAHISNHAATKSDDDGLSIAPRWASFSAIASMVARRFEVSPSAMASTWAQIRRRFERSNQLRSPTLPDGWNGHDKNAARLRQQVGENGSRPRQQAGFNQGIGPSAVRGVPVTAASLFNDSVWLSNDTPVCPVYDCPFMKGLPAGDRIFVVGAGVAGFRAAIELAAAGRVLVLTKGEVADPTNAVRQSDARLSDEDEVILHLRDTLTAGDGLCNLAAVTTLLEEARSGSRN